MIDGNDDGFWINSSSFMPFVIMGNFLGLHGSTQMVGYPSSLPFGFGFDYVNILSCSSRFLPVSSDHLLFSPSEKEHNYLSKWIVCIAPKNMGVFGRVMSPDSIDCEIHMSASRQRTLSGGGQIVLDYLKRMQAENPSFYYAVQVTFDTTCRTNRYRVPLTAFTGLNHHGQPVLFGCALLFNESESSFVWLFQSWLNAMSGRAPVSITTDPDRFIQVAVSQVLPETRHRFSKWGIFRETQEKLAHIYQSHPTFEPEFQKCINETETIDEFESCWESLLERYYLMDNEWLQSMYNARQQWVPVYMRDTFFGEMHANKGNEGMSSFFDGYVNAATTIQMLIKQYEKAVASWHEKELKADYDTSNTTPNWLRPLLILQLNDDSGTVTTYRVSKFGDDHKAHSVRHILAVFRAKNVLTLPSQYILKRWTRNAKSGAVLDEQASELPSNSRESLTVRYNSLRQEAIKYVEEGAKSIHVYNVAMDALQEAVRKVAAAKIKVLELHKVAHWQMEAIKRCVPEKKIEQRRINLWFPGVDSLQLRVDGFLLFFDLFVVRPSLPRILPGKWVIGNFTRHNNDWEMREVETLFRRLNGQVLRRDDEDVMNWWISKKGLFTVKSFYSSLAPYNAR
ncbi:Protein FAR1-related sequence 9 [Vitis vinifera]|uniref:Protein FAR1-RELATED SEQUENCE n=1 Tax=Vitis vinifera TaxID=29760 RepID=A0A438JTG4_VITVI|nr:Protein FAR1-related sequence 9 [Vitis vinifera]